MNLLSVLGFVLRIWPIVSRVVPVAVEAVQAVADKDLSGEEKKAVVFKAVRAVVGAAVVPDALLNWLIETVLQVLRWKGTK
jgi:hypothetical protein